jgi:iron complex transport system ATP-binding protein
MSLCVNNLSVQIKQRTILQDINTAFEPGKITVLLGPNGAGKTTLLRSLASLTNPASGTLSLNGLPLQSTPARQRAQLIGLLPQSADVHWDITVRNLVALGRLPHSRWFIGESPVDTRAITSAMIATDVMQFADRTILSLSGGERARVMLARVIAGEPQWLLADEPLAHLDLAHQIDVLNIFKTSAKNGCGIILVLHDLALAARTADQILLLSHGRIVASGAPNTVLTAINISNVYNVAIGIAEEYVPLLNQ